MMRSSSLLKKSVQDFFNYAKQKYHFCFASFFKHLRVRKMAVGPSTTPQFVEKRVFQQTASKAIFAVIFVLCVQQDVFSFEQSASIKAITILKTESSWDGKPIVYPEGKPEITGMLVTIAPGSETGWHLHPVPSFGVLLEGELEVRLKNGDVRRIKSGEALAEVVNTLHNGRNVGSTPVKLVVFYAGAVGEKLSIKAP